MIQDRFGYFFLENTFLSLILAILMRDSVLVIQTENLLHRLCVLEIIYIFLFQRIIFQHILSEATNPAYIVWYLVLNAYQLACIFSTHQKIFIRHKSEIISTNTPLIMRVWLFQLVVVQLASRTHVLQSMFSGE